MKADESAVISNFDKENQSTNSGNHRIEEEQEAFKLISEKHKAITEEPDLERQTSSDTINIFN